MPAVYTISVLKPVAVFENSYFDQYNDQTTLNQVRLNKRNVYKKTTTEAQLNQS